MNSNVKNFKVYIERDVLGNCHVMIEHLATETTHRHCTFYYQYPFFDNASVIKAADAMARSLGGKPPIDIFNTGTKHCPDMTLSD
ncbi:hypothetical protein AB4254_11525 [Vibrio breoganii]